ncbi:uncharacterized protein LOC131093188 isoform X2 [Melospiza georgiana]|uniref:uncharacterized protein LOC131093188 isoform X2 n=1 Tax=Melospiza georgiana TaxID=44398 RepID=UPI0025AC9640|nr:uncharacterized protein LOC131093188 isoform X2 [Melospiza georgiana]
MDPIPSHPMDPIPSQGILLGLSWMIQVGQEGWHSQQGLWRSRSCRKELCPQNWGGSMWELGLGWLCTVLGVPGGFWECRVGREGNPLILGVRLILPLGILSWTKELVLWQFLQLRDTPDPSERDIQGHPRSLRKGHPLGTSQIPQKGTSRDIPDPSERDIPGVIPDPSERDNQGHPRSLRKRHPGTSQVPQKGTSLGDIPDPSERDIQGHPRSLRKGQRDIPGPSERDIQGHPRSLRKGHPRDIPGSLRDFLPHWCCSSLPRPHSRCGSFCSGILEFFLFFENKKKKSFPDAEAVPAWLTGFSWCLHG